MKKNAIELFLGSRPLRLKCIALALALMCQSVLAEDSAVRLQGFLPDTETVRSILLATPQVQEGRARRLALESRARMVETGAAEFSVHTNQQRRRTSDALLPGSQNEQTIGIERPLRLWNKSATDRTLADRTRELAEIIDADTIHETSRDLLRQLFDVLRAETEASASAQANALLQELERNIAGRQRRGDVALQDLRLVRAEALRTTALAAAARNQSDRAWNILQQRFPGLQRPSATRLPDTAALTLEDPLTVNAWFLERSHELNVLRAELARQQAVSVRSIQDRLPDPTVGVYTARERAGAERITGLSLSIPLPGQYRQSQADAAGADARAAANRLQVMETRLLSEFSDRWQQARHRLDTLPLMQDAAQLQQEVAIKAMKAYSLGEGLLTDAVLQQRLASEQHKAYTLHRLEFIALWAEIELDLHRLWDFD